MATTSTNAHAVSYVPINNPSFTEYNRIWGFYGTPPAGCVGIRFDTLDTTPIWGNYRIFYPSHSSTIVGNGSLSGNSFNFDFTAGNEYWIGFYSSSGGAFTTSVINNVALSWIMPSADTNNYATEQRYFSTNWGSDQFTKSNSLPLIYSMEHYLSEFVPEGQCNSIQVDASTVGGDALEWRLNLGQSGIDGQTAWLPIGYKMPVEVGGFDLHSVQLRMKDPSDPTQYYPLDPSELSLCTVTYGYSSDVVLQLPHSDYQELPTDSGYEEIQAPTVPSLDDLAGDYRDGWIADYLSVPLAMVARVFAPILLHGDLFVLVVAAVFTAIVFAIIW